MEQQIGLARDLFGRRYLPGFVGLNNLNKTELQLKLSLQQADTAGEAVPQMLQIGAKGAYIVRLLMVGDRSCGKTSLVLRFDQNVFSTKFVHLVPHPEHRVAKTYLLRWEIM